MAIVKFSELGHLQHRGLVSVAWLFYLTVGDKEEAYFVIFYEGIDVISWVLSICRLN